MSTLVQNPLLPVRNWIIACLLLLIAGVTQAPQTAHAQGVSAEGREFWFGFMPNADLPAQQINVFVATGTANRIKVETYGESGDIVRTQSITLAADETYAFNMSVGLSETRKQETAAHRAIRVTSTAPCVVYGYSDNNLSTDGFLALPVTGFGKEYYCVSYYDDWYYFIGSTSHLGGEFLIVAPYDGTEVTITTTAHTTTSEDGYTISRNPGDTWKVTLNKGMTYLVQTTGRLWGEDDLTGSKVTSTKPIGFLTGHQRAQIETTADNSKDHLIEMIPPTDRWGTEYYSVAHWNRKDGDYYRLISAEDNNKISVNGNIYTLNAGQWAEIPTQKAPTVFKSTNGKRFLTMDYSYHQNYNGDPALGDPHIITMIPKEQFQKRMIFRTPVNVGSAFKHYAIAVYHKDGISKMTIKRGQADPQNFAAYQAGGTISFPGSDYVASVLQISGDAVTWITEGPVPMGIYQYGFTQTEGYGWPAGMALKIISKDPMAPLETRVEDCGDYEVELTETHVMPTDAWDDTKIADYYMIEEPDDINWPKPSFNYTFEPDPAFIVGATTTKFTLKVQDKTQDAYAAIYTVDQAGNDSLYEYFYEAPKLSATPKPTYDFGFVLADEDTCMEITLRNDQTNGEVEITTAAIMGYAPAGAFTVLPQDINRKLAPGETMKLQICFKALDTLVFTDTLVVQTTCAPFKFALTGEGVIPKIYAHDKYYGMVPNGETRCLPVKVENQGKYTLIINSTDLATDPNWTLDLTQTDFPIILEPGAFADVWFCMTSTSDSDDYEITVTYRTNIPARFAHLNKNFSVLNGIVRRAGAQLTVLNQGFGPTNCIERPTYIDTLYNDGTLDKAIDSVAIIGPGGGSYKIISSDPPGNIYNFVLSPSPKEGGIKYLIQFDPNYAGLTTAPQEAELIAFTKDEGAVTITKLSGSRIAPVLTLVADAPIDFGAIKTNNSKSMTFDVVNTGTDVLEVVDIQKIGGDGPFFTLDKTQFNVNVGQSETVTVTFAPGTQARNFAADFVVIPKTPGCTVEQTARAIARSTENEYTASGADYATVFTCKDRTLEGSFSNFSSDEEITITDYGVVAANGWNDATDFQIVSPLTAPIVLPRGNGTVQIPVRFTPTATGVRNAGLRITFELEGQSRDTVVPLTGIGDVVPQIVAVGAVAGGVRYTATMNDELRVPIRLSESFTNRNADVRGYSFDVSFKRDAFSFAADVAGPANVTVQRVFKSYDATSDMETYTISTNGLAPNEITVDNFAAELHLLPRVHPGIESDITVENAAWLDANGAVLCYIPTDYVPATYQFDPLCGDAALQAYLNNKSLQDIAFGFITPNPVRSDAQISFDVNIEAPVTLSIFDALGNEVAKLLTGQNYKVGTHSVTFDASNFAEGAYYCRLSNGKTTFTQRMVIAK
ncbi:MAG TPA: choice-of-anchor D domain-containing protein [Candidatus Kapabacteria bacterium]|nr:choice-of-anchor D domain-containing protein [Candidatus Kapabacteria bacterium]